MFKLRPGNMRRTAGRLQKAKHVGPRLERQKVARRSPGENKVHKALLKALKFSSGFLGTVVCLGLVSTVLLAGYGYFTQHPYFKVKKVQVEGAHYLSRLEILRAAGIGSETSILSLPLARAQSGITGLDWVRRAEVKRRLPDTVHIKVEEFRAHQLALVEGELHFLDAEERVFAPIILGLPPDLPVFTGLSRADLQDPDEEIKQLLQASVGLLKLLSARPSPSLSDLSEVHLDRVWGISLIWTHLRPIVRLGFNDFQGRLTRLAKVVTDLKRRGELERTVLIDLNAGPRVVVRLGREPA